MDRLERARSYDWPISGMPRYVLFSLGRLRSLDEASSSAPNKIPISATTVLPLSKLAIAIQNNRLTVDYKHSKVNLALLDGDYSTVPRKKTHPAIMVISYFVT
jgi:hypothetical protein